ncbi:MAG: RimK family protein [Gammaproteobacteria bacterium]|nr:RimK family protein [Gammaproteobacteria bacterium]MDH5653872.1 RimK family protein [Gammaproteobacteria bacterium]
MHSVLIVVDKPQDWTAYYPSDNVISVQDYLSQPGSLNNSAVQVINLCRSYKYLTNGYYCSLLAEARNHKVIPSVRSINDLSNKSLYSLDIGNLNQLLEKALHDRQLENDTLSLKLFFGNTDIPELESLGRQIFELYPCPILVLTIRLRERWFVESIKPGALNTLQPSEEDLFAEALERFNKAVWRKPRSKKLSRYDLAILVDPEEKLPPSDKTALKKFVSIGKQMGINVELITRKDYVRLAEYDALFIRETTAIDNHTYRFAKRAESEGMVVIDDPQSILRCTNKIYLADLLNTNGVPTPITQILSKDRLKEDIATAVNSLGFPMVLKIPDGSFSRGIVKVEDEEQLKTHLAELFKQSALVLAQAYTYTEYDWRIGVLNKKPIFACKYFMSRGHWQIYKHNASSGTVESGTFQTLPVYETPKKILDVATRAANLIGDGLYGVDVKQIGDAGVVIEVNDNPNIDSGVETNFLKDDLYRIILEEFIRRLERKRIGI